MPVFTAHPSEARRATVLEKLWRIAQQLDRLERVHLLPQERAQVLRQIEEDIETLWLTDLVRVRRPSVRDEIRQGLHVVEGALFEVIPRLYRVARATLHSIYPDYKDTLPALLRFGSWIGGDRDGHPHVTHAVTAEAVRFQQQVVLQHYCDAVKALAGRLSQTAALAPPTADLQASLAEDDRRFPDWAEAFPREPYRRKCHYIAARLERTLHYLEHLELRWSDQALSLPAEIYLGRRNCWRICGCWRKRCGTIMPRPPRVAWCRT